VEHILGWSDQAVTVNEVRKSEIVDNALDVCVDMTVVAWPTAAQSELIRGVVGDATDLGLEVPVALVLAHHDRPIGDLCDRLLGRDLAVRDALAELDELPVVHVTLVKLEYTGLDKMGDSGVAQRVPKNLIWV
jgi:hypothetical protein